MMLLSLVLVYLFYEAAVICLGQQFLRYKFYAAAVIGSGILVL